MLKTELDSTALILAVLCDLVKCFVQVDDLRCHFEGQAFDSHDTKDDQEGGGQKDNHQHAKEHILDQGVSQINDGGRDLRAIREKGKFHCFSVDDFSIIGQLKG